MTLVNIIPRRTPSVLFAIALFAAFLAMLLLGRPTSTKGEGTQPSDARLTVRQ